MTETELDNINEEIAEIIRYETIRTLSYLGDACVKRIRDRSEEESWIDDTGNLRSSIGFAIYDQGKKAMESAFEIVKKGNKGAEQGREFVNELAKQYSRDYVLVIVAGMEYAEYVERRDNKDVLASTELWSKTKIDDYMQRTQKRIEKKINQIINS